MVKVLFVCAGNICRSPMAEAVFRDMVNKAGLGDKFSIDSAGMGAWYVGDPADSRTLAVLKRHNIPYDGRARQVERADLSRFDYVLAMDSENLLHLRRMATGANARVMLFLEYARQAGTVNTDEVPDPYYSGVFDQVYELVTKGSAALLEHLRAEHGL